MMHFQGNPECPLRTHRLHVSEAETEDEFRELRAEFPDDYCSACVPGKLEPPMSPNITARSLVGMSESAKRRAARAQFVELVFASQGTKCKPGDKGPRWFHLWCRGSGDVASRDPDYAALRTKYRIGERLRPCLGCSWCATPPAENAKCHTQCDSSGVLPARKATARAR